MLTFKKWKLKFSSIIDMTRFLTLEFDKMKRKTNSSQKKNTHTFLVIRFFSVE
jgi:hypothetical protein